MDSNFRHSLIFIIFNKSLGRGKKHSEQGFEQRKNLLIDAEEKPCKADPGSNKTKDGNYLSYYPSSLFFSDYLYWL